MCFCAYVSCQKGFPTKTTKNKKQTNYITAPLPPQITCICNEDVIMGCCRYGCTITLMRTEIIGCFLSSDAIHGLAQPPTLMLVSFAGVEELFSYFLNNLCVNLWWQTRICAKSCKAVLWLLRYVAVWNLKLNLKGSHLSQWHLWLCVWKQKWNLRVGCSSPETRGYSRCCQQSLDQTAVGVFSVLNAFW